MDCDLGLGTFFGVSPDHLTYHGYCRDVDRCYLLKKVHILTDSYTLHDGLGVERHTGTSSRDVVAEQDSRLCCKKAVVAGLRLQRSGSRGFSQSDRGFQRFFLSLTQR